MRSSSTPTHRTLTDLRRDDAGVSPLRSALIALGIGVAMAGYGIVQRVHATPSTNSISQPERPPQ